MKNVTRKLEDQSGYSMVEVLAAIVILSLAILPMVGMFDAGLRAAVLGGNYDKARSLANSNLESVKAMDYSEAVASYPPGFSSTTCPNSEAGFDCKITTLSARVNEGSGEIETNGGAAGSMLEVTVEVSWNGGDYKTSGITSTGGVG